MDRDAANAACDALVKTYDAELRRYAKRLLPDEGDDAVSDLWEQVLRGRRLSDPPERWRSYLFMVLYRKIRQRWCDNEAERQMVVLHEDAHAEAGRSAFEISDARLDVRRLRQLVPRTLSLPELSTVLLHEYGFKDREVARMTGVRNVATVRSRALCKIRRALDLKPPPPTTSRPGPTKG